MSRFRRSSRLLQAATITALAGGLVLAGGAATASAGSAPAPAPSTGTTLESATFSVPAVTDSTRRVSVMGDLIMESHPGASAVTVSITCDDRQVFGVSLAPTGRSNEYLQYRVELPLAESGHTCTLHGFVRDEAHPLVFAAPFLSGPASAPWVIIHATDGVVRSKSGGL